MRDLVNAIDWVALGRDGMKYFIHVRGIDIGLDDHDVIGKDPGLRRPYRMGHAPREIHKRNFSGNNGHMPDAIGGTEDPSHRQPELS